MADRSAASRRRSPRYSTPLIGALLLAAVGLGWFTVRLRQAKSQREAANKIRKLGGWAFYNCRYDQSGRVVQARPAAPRWLTRLVGVDFVATVNGVTLAGGRQLEGLPRIDFLMDHGIPVTDAAIAVVEDLPELQWLALSQTEITRAREFGRTSKAQESMARQDSNHRCGTSPSVRFDGT
jgi:hypothetical protein